MRKTKKLDCHEAKASRNDFSLSFRVKRGIQPMKIFQNTVFQMDSSGKALRMTGLLGKLLQKGNTGC